MSAQTAHALSDPVQRVGRLFLILTRVRLRRPGQRLGRPELAEICACDAQTIQRDINLLKQRIHVPIEYVRAEQAYILTDRKWSFPVVELTGEDALALTLARNLLAIPGLPHQEAITRALDKASAGLSPEVRALVTQAARVLRPARLPRDYSAAPIQPLVEAATERQAVEIDYESRSRGAREWRRVDPYAVERRDGLYWELHGWCPRNAMVRTFALDRVHAVRLVGESFTVRAEDWAAFAGTQGVLGGLRGGEDVAVEVRFAPKVAAYARDKQWPPTLSTRLETDGSLLLTGAVRGVEGIVPEILRWRRHAEVRGGPELRARMAEEVRALSALYADADKKSEPPDPE